MAVNKIKTFLSLVEIWNTTQDIDKILGFLTDDLVWHYSAVTVAPKLGHAGAREFLNGYAQRVTRPQWRIFSYAENGDTLMAEGVDAFYSREGDHLVEVPYMGAYQFRGDKIYSWRDYFDRGVVERGMKGEKLPAHARELVDRKAVSA